MESMLESLVDRCVVAMGGKSREEHEKDLFSTTSMKNEAVSDYNQLSDRFAADTKAHSSATTWVQHLGKDLLLQLVVASFMAVLAISWLYFVKRHQYYTVEM